MSKFYLLWKQSIIVKPTFYYTNIIYYYFKEQFIYITNCKFNLLLNS